jgi:phosphatidylserine decarboxylase
MKHAGKATRAAFKLIQWTLYLLLALLLAGMLARLLGEFVFAIASGLGVIWVLFVLFCVWFFRDPEPSIPADASAILAPAHGKVDVIDEVEEPLFVGGRCRRISIFLSVFDVHVQRTPVAGRVSFLKYTRGQFLNALGADSAKFNENLLVGIESSERPGERIAVRLIAGLIARRIVPWVAEGDGLTRGERISLIQFGSRVDLYLPLSAKVAVPLNSHVRGGETVIATRG